MQTHLGQLPQEQLADKESSTEELLALDPNLFKVSEEDIHQCYKLAERVGNKWAEVLQRQGYDEFARIAFALVKKGRYLEPSDDNGQQSTAEDHDANKEDDEQQQQMKSRNKFASTYTALHALRRYPPDCDGSGIPLQHIPAPQATNDSEDHADTSAQRLIQQLDQMAHNGETNWYHGWDAIEEAAERNKVRMEYSRVRGGGGAGVGSNKEDYDIVPKQHYDVNVNVDDEEEEKKRGTDDDDAIGKDDDALAEAAPSKKRACSDRDRTVQFKEDVSMAQGDDQDDGTKADLNFLLSTNKKAASILKRRKRGQQRQQLEEGASNLDEESGWGESCTDNAPGDEKRRRVLEEGRPPSSIGVEVLSWEDMLNSMTMEERRELIVSTIHPPHPFESEVVDDMIDEDVKNDERDLEDVTHNAVVCGAVKDFGHTHLWEQTRNLPDTSDNSQEDITSNGDDLGETGGKEVIYGVSEARAAYQSQQLLREKKRSLTRATKERLGRRTISTAAEYKAGYAKVVVKCSKVEWTEDDEVVSGKEDDIIGGNGVVDSSLPDQQSVQQQRKWLDMDLGECTIELTEDGEHVNGTGKQLNEEPNVKTKRFLAFRSLELALNY